MSVAMSPYLDRWAETIFGDRKGLIVLAAKAITMTFTLDNPRRTAMRPGS
jgi:hypothetical protein